MSAANCYRAVLLTSIVAYLAGLWLAGRVSR